jgi:NADH-quinone oxidoreductase subunit J
MSTVLGPMGMRIGAVLSMFLAAEILWALWRIGVGWFTQGATAASVSSVALIGSGIYTRHVFAFEATSVLILVAILGAVVLARREHS